MTAQAQTKAQHTPGYWRVSPLESKENPCEIHATRCDTRGRRIALVCAIYSGDTQAGANAKLLAAAPELAEALAGLVAAGNCNYDAHTMRAEGMFSRALAALEKAGVLYPAVHDALAERLSRRPGESR